MGSSSDVIYIEIKTKQCENLKLNIVLQIRVESVFYCILFYKITQDFFLFSKSTKINTDILNSAIHFMPLTKK